MQKDQDTGNSQNSHQPGGPKGDAKDCCQLDVPAPDTASGCKGDSEQEQKAAEKSEETVQKDQAGRRLRKRSGNI